MKTRACTLIFLLSAAFSNAMANTPITAAFDWFQYEGRDAVFDEALEDDHFRNPVIAGFNPDPSIARVNDDYYLVTSSFAYFPGLPIYHSQDLVHWELIGHALTRRSQLTLENGQGISRGIFAPTLRFHDKLFYIINTDVDGIGNFFITAENPAGPWSDPVLLPEINGIDPDLFFDDDGRVYITHNGEPEGGALYQGHRAIWQWEFDLENSRVIAGSGRMIVDGGVDLSQQPIWIEAPHIYKHDGWYYLSCAEGGTEDQHSQVIFRTRNLAEPFVPWENNPILTQRDLDPGRDNPITSTGHADMVELPNGEWWAVFLGTRTYDRKFHNTGRETFLLPVRWQNGWPVILKPQTVAPWQVRRPKLREASEVILPQNGNFSWRDDFDQPGLNLAWNRVRTSQTDWFMLDEAAGKIRLRALPIPLSHKSQPAFLGRRQQHLAFSASTQLVLPSTEGVAAGLVAFQSSDFHYFLGVHKTDAKYVVFLEEVRMGVSSIMASAEVPAHENEMVLGMEQEGALIAFNYSMPGDEPIILIENVDAKLLSTQLAGGFVGTTIGMHARSEPGFAPVFGDRMVLQRGQPINIWGYAVPQTELLVTLAQSDQTVTVDSDGAWEAQFPPLPSGGPHELKLTTSEGVLQFIQNILIGDVYLCSGQSNMAFRVAQTSGVASGALETHENIRLMTVGRDNHVKPQPRHSNSPEWKIADPESISEFSAVCYFFALELQKNLNQPIGLINASWGGSHIESWISANGLRQTGNHDRQLALLNSYVQNATMGSRQFGETWESWWRQNSPESDQPWLDQAKKSSGWQATPPQMQDWKTYGDPALAEHHGMVWYRTSFQLTDEQSQQNAMLTLGGIDEVDASWVNGQFTGTQFGWGSERVYPVPGEAFRPGTNNITVNVLNTWGSGGMIGPNEKVGLKFENGDFLPLGENWLYRKVPAETGMPPLAPWHSINGLTGLFNAMIAPLEGLNFASALWYQGESNTAKGREYESLLKALIADWRHHFSTTLPFLIVQLPNFGSVAAAPVESGWAEVRDAQRRVAVDDANTGLVVTIDTGDQLDIHPSNKQIVGRRAAEVALAMLYEEDGIIDGLSPIRAFRQNNEVAIEFRKDEGHLISISAGRLTAFELCGEEPESCSYADARIEGNSVRLTAPESKSIKRVRHCWADSPICNLYGASGLPVSSFELSVEP